MEMQCGHAGTEHFSVWELGTHYKPSIYGDASANLWPPFIFILQLIKLKKAYISGKKFNSEYKVIKSKMLLKMHFINFKLLLSLYECFSQQILLQIS